MVLYNLLLLYQKKKILLSVRPNITQKYLFNWLHPFISKTVLIVAAWPDTETKQKQLKSENKLHTFTEFESCV